MVTEFSTSFSYCIDWLSLVIPQDIPVLERWRLWDWRRMGRGHHGYKSLYVAKKNGMQLQGDGHDISMGQNIICTGDCLRTLRREQKNADVLLLRWSLERGGHVARIDLCCDVQRTEFPPNAAYRAWERGEFRTAAKTLALTIGGATQSLGETVYVGSRQSERMARIYDKAAEQGQIDGPPWTRVELELKGAYARGAGQALAHAQPAHVFAGMMSEFISWDDPVFQKMLEGKKVGVEPVIKENKATRDWLIGSVVPSLARQCQVENDFLNTFLDELARQIDNISD
jgi:hypothetical protein